MEQVQIVSQILVPPVQIVVQDQILVPAVQIMNLLLLEAEYLRNLRGWASLHGVSNNNNNLEISGDTKIGGFSQFLAIFDDPIQKCRLFFCFGQKYLYIRGEFSRI